MFQVCLSLTKPKYSAKVRKIQQRLKLEKTKLADGMSKDVVRLLQTSEFCCFNFLVILETAVCGAVEYNDVREVFLLFSPTPDVSGA